MKLQSDSYAGMNVREIVASLEADSRVMDFLRGHNLPAGDVLDAIATAFFVHGTKSVDVHADGSVWIVGFTVCSESVVDIAIWSPTPQHKCGWETITWDDLPDATTHQEKIEWWGTCQCGRRVKEVFYSDGVMDADNNPLFS
jgi:hypothetical protein